MAEESYSRGYKIYFEHKNNVWKYYDNDQPVNDNRECARCKKIPTIKDHDACIGDLPGTYAACCGHGKYKPYVRRENKLYYGKKDMLRTFLKRLIRYILFFIPALILMATARYESCCQCGIPYNAVYSIDDRLWIRIAGSGKISLCPECFHRKAESKGYIVTQDIEFTIKGN